MCSRGCPDARAYDNVEHILAENREFAAQLVHVDELLMTVYGPRWLPALEAAAKRVTRKGGAKKSGSMRSALPIAVRVYPDLPSRASIAR